jgi:predicted nucleic acid-binding protein
VNQETINVATERGFQEVSEDAILEFLESRSVILMNEEPAELDRRTCKGVQDYHDDDESDLTDKYSTLAIKKSLVETFNKVDETLD